MLYLSKSHVPSNEKKKNKKNKNNRGGREGKAYKAQSAEDPTLSRPLKYNQGRIRSSVREEKWPKARDLSVAWRRAELSRRPKRKRTKGTKYGSRGHEGRKMVVRGTRRATRNGGGATSLHKFQPSLSLSLPPSLGLSRRRDKSRETLSFSWTRRASDGALKAVV